MRLEGLMLSSSGQIHQLRLGELHFTDRMGPPYLNSTPVLLLIPSGWAEMTFLHNLTTFNSIWERGQRCVFNCRQLLAVQKCLFSDNLNQRVREVEGILWFSSVTMHQRQALRGQPLHLTTHGLIESCCFRSHFLPYFLSKHASTLKILIRVFGKTQYAIILPLRSVWRTRNIFQMQWQQTNKCA